MLAADLATEGRKVLFVPLHFLEPEAGVAKATSAYLKDADFFQLSPLDDLSSDDPVILILDGLDELQMQGKAAQEAAQSLVSDLCRFVDRVNSSRCKLMTIITGREIAVQGAEGYFRTEGQVLHMLPYFVSESTRENYSDPQNLLSEDQRNLWWIAFGKVVNKDYDAIPSRLATGDIGEVTAQPLLNYLVALSFNRGLTIDKDTNVNSVYEDLLKAVYERGWSKNRRWTAAACGSP